MRPTALALFGLVPLLTVVVLTQIVEVNPVTSLSGAVGATVPALMLYVVMASSNGEKHEE
ncbi:hypothetical protein [Salinibaculum rarum]|uniref:hypothetical protein n=1 Tax=Salinibaculum rarum TaxID=3058903 RepID=UPI00265DD2C4|nr:hypothetical protein [Salinibaculum sp. KK48]